MDLLIAYLIFILFSLTVEIFYCVVPHTKRTPNYELKPIGLKVWSLILIVLSSILPLINLGTVLVMIADIASDCCYWGYDRVFPEEVQKKSTLLKVFNIIYNFFNAEIKA